MPKPIRAHHCSICRNCVMNMDHHCPWLNSCVGFWNRKTFILVLVYVNLLILTWTVSMWREYLSLIQGVYGIVTTQKPNPDFTGPDGLSTFLFQLFSVFVLFMWVLQFNFTRYHIVLILNNKTTIGMLAHKNKPYRSEFDKGTCGNLS